MRGGGRSYSSRGSGGFRGSSNNNYRGNNSSGGRYNNSNAGSNHRYGGSNNTNSANHSSNSNRSRHDYGSSSDRFSSRKDEPRSSYNNNRNHSRGRGESPNRKRARYEGSSSRRDFGNNSLDYNHRYDSHGHSSSGVGSNSSYRRNNSLRHLSPAATSNHSPARNARGNGTGGGDKTSSLRSKERMGPPNRLPLKKFRGGVNNKGGNGFRGGRDSASSRGIRKTKMVPSARTNIVRRRLVMRQRDSARRVKIARLRSSMKKRDVTKNTSKSGDEDTTEISEKKLKTDETDEKTSDNATAESPKKKTIASINARKSASSTEVNKENKADEVEEENDDVEKLPDDENANDEKKDNGNDDDKDTKNKANGKKVEKTRSSPKKFIRLTCVHCRTKCLTFQDYTNHLYSRIHKAELRRVVLRQKSQLARMRLAQRNAQRELDEASKDTENISAQFCLLCRLNYRTPKDEHQASEAHRNMKIFLMPYCKVCRIAFKSPMVYETHRCSLEHIKRKARQSSEPKDNENNDNDDDEGLQVDLNKFLTVDSVGDVDGNHFSQNEDSDDNAEDAPPKSEINVGNEHVKKIEVFYCDLCRFYLPHLEDPEASMQKHCSTRNHLRAYLRFKENQSLKQAAELIHRRDHAKSVEPRPDGQNESADKANDDLTVDKVWEDVEKDLGEIINQVKMETNNEDEDEDSTATTERYDRFKNSGKLDTDLEKATIDVNAVDKTDIDLIASAEAVTQPDIAVAQE